MRIATIPAKQTQLVTLNGVWEFTEGFTIPRHVRLSMPYGTGIKAPFGVTIKVEGQIAAGRYTIFPGEGIIELDRKVCKAEWHGATPDATYDTKYRCTNYTTATPSYHAFRKAKLSVGDYGTISYGPGGFLQRDATFQHRRDNGGWAPTNFCLRAHEPRSAQDSFFSHFLTVELDRRTVLLADSENDRDVFGALDVAPYRDGGWANRLSDLYPYFDTVAKGAAEVTVKIATPQSFVSKMGYVSGGASGFDQFSPGQFVRVSEMFGNTLLFERSIEHDLSVAKSSAGGYVTQAFQAPGNDEEVDVVMSIVRNRTVEPPGAKDAFNVFSIGTDLYQNLGVGTLVDSFRCKKVGGKGSAVQGTTIPVGTPVFRRRVFNLTPSCIQNFTVRGGTIAGVRGGMRVSNTYEALAENVHFVWRPLRNSDGSIVNDGLYFDSDASYGHQQRYCTFTCFDMIGSSQWARASVNGSQYKCKFVNARWDATEGCLNITAERCEWHLNFTRYGAGHDEYAFIIGQTTGETRIIWPKIYVQGASQIISGAGVQEFTATMGGGCVFEHPLIYATNCGTIFGGPFNGNNEIISPRIYGDTRFIFGRTGTNPADGISGDENGRFAYGGGMRVKDLLFDGKLDAISSAPLMTAHVQGRVYCRGTQNPDGAGATDRAYGTILRGEKNKQNEFIDIEPSDLKLDLVLYGWPYAAGGLYGPNYVWNSRSYALLDFRKTVFKAGDPPSNGYAAFGNIQAPYVKPITTPTPNPDNP